MWYVVQVETGREKTACDDIKQAADDVLDECFVPQYLTGKRRPDGTWIPSKECLFPGYLICVTSQVDELADKLRRVRSLTKILGNDNAFIPLTEDEQAWVQKVTQKNQRTVGESVGYMENGKLVNNLRNEAIEDYQNWMYGLWQSDYIALGVGDYGWTSRDYYIGEGKLLFYPCGLWALGTEKSQWSKTFGEDVFFVPVPKYDKADEYYIPTSVNAYCFVKGGHNPEGVGKFLDCFRFSKISDGAQEISDEQFVKDYEWTDEMIEMKNKMNEMALANPVFDYYNGISSDVTDILDSSVNGIRATSRGIPWNESVNAIYDQTQNFIDEVNEKNAAE